MPRGLKKGSSPKRDIQGMNRHTTYRKLEMERNENKKLRSAMLEAAKKISELEELEIKKEFLQRAIAIKQKRAEAVATNNKKEIAKLNKKQKELSKEKRSFTIKLKRQKELETA